MAIPTSDYDTQSYTNNTGATIEGFTFLLDLSEQSSDFKSNWNSSDGGRGRACKSDGTTELACDFINLNHTTKTGVVAVYWGDLANGATATIRLYPPNTANSEYLASDTYGSDNAYPSKVAGYWPLQNNGNDRTANGYDLTAYGSPSFASGPLGNMASLNGSDQYFEGSHAPVDRYPLYMFAHVRPADVSQSGVETVMMICDSAQTAHFNSLNIYNEGAMYYERFSGNVFPTADGVDYADGNDHTFGGGVYIDGDLLIYVHGDVTDSDNAIDSTYTNPWSPTINRISIGRSGDQSPSGYFNGGISHVFLLSEYPSDAWREAMHDQVIDNATFWGTRTWSGSGGGTTVLMTPLSGPLGGPLAGRF